MREEGRGEGVKSSLKDPLNRRLDEQVLTTTNDGSMAFRFRRRFQAAPFFFSFFFSNIS